MSDYRRRYLIEYRVGQTDTNTGHSPQFWFCRTKRGAFLRMGWECATRQDGGVSIFDLHDDEQIICFAVVETSGGSAKATPSTGGAGQ